MSLTTEGMSPADFAAMNGNNGGMFGGDGAWWLIILFLFIFAGNGFGNNNSGAAENYVLSSDFATLQRQIDTQADGLRQQSTQIANGLCDGFYTQAQLVNGVNLNMANGFSQAELSRANGQAAITAQMNANNITAMQNSNAVQTQIASCCCQNKEAIAGVNYNMSQNTATLQRSLDAINYNNATNTCAINTNVSNGVRDIVDNQNQNTRAILDALNAQQIAAKDAQIAAQNQRIFGLELAASQAAQNQYLIGQLRPAPVGGCPYSST